MSPLAGTSSLAIEQLRHGLDTVASADLTPVGVDDAVGLVRELETQSRRLAAVQLRVLDAIDKSDLYRSDGHASAKSFMRHISRLSNATATCRDRSLQVLGDLPELAKRFETGEVGVDQINLLGRVSANPRVRGQMAEQDSWFCQCAITLSYRDFEIAVRQWERLADQDGPEPVNSRNHEQRNARLSQDPVDLSWELFGSYAAFQGASMKEILDHYVEAELAADWEKAKAEHGDAACYADLGRSQPQRRADALWQIFQDAAVSEIGAVPPGFVHNIVWDADTFEQMMTKLDSEDNNESPRPDQKMDPRTYRCETIDGVQLEPVEAMVNATVSAVRRVLMNAKGVTIDLGQARRFTGNARHAVRLNSSCCIWPGCEVPASRCETDHQKAHSAGGLTTPENGAVMCGKHNRWKQKGFTVRRDQAGNWSTYRPIGDRIP